MMAIMISNDDYHYEDDGDKGLSIYYVLGGVFPIYYNITQGGSPQFITLLHRGGR